MHQFKHKDVFDREQLPGECVPEAGAQLSASVVSDTKVEIGATGFHSALSKSLHRLTKRANSAFTLVEVALSLGIVAFAFIPLMGLLPLGLGMSRQAIDTTVQSQIVQRMIAEAQQTDFSNLVTLAASSTSNPYYFDDQGNNSSAVTNQVYEAIYSVSTNTLLPRQVSTKKLATVTICILNKNTDRANLTETDLTRNADSKKFIVLIPDNGR